MKLDYGASPVFCNGVFMLTLPTRDGIGECSESVALMPQFTHYARPNQVQPIPGPMWA